MKYFSIYFLVALVFLGTNGRADENSPQQTVVKEDSVLSKIKDVIGLNYNSFFAGPGVGMSVTNNPGFTGEPSDTGLNFFNYISLNWKVTKAIAVDLQFRNQLVVTNQVEFRHQGQRLGVSGTFLHGDDWSLWGAFNSDIPIASLTGQINMERTLLFNPGMFSFFSYEPKGSRFFLFALLAPRVFVYSNPEAVAIQDALNGGTKIKPVWDIYLNPSINYRLTDKTSLRLGTTIEYTKFVGLPGFVRNYLPFEFGVKHDFSDLFSIYTYVQSSTPLDDEMRAAQGFGNNPWYKTMSLNLWFSGTIL